MLRMVYDHHGDSGKLSWGYQVTLQEIVVTFQEILVTVLWIVGDYHWDQVLRYPCYIRRINFNTKV